jgi:alpha-L-fucosidase
MNKTLLLLFLGLIVIAPAEAKTTSAADEGVTVEMSSANSVVAETREQRDTRMAWWREAKFGLFIHWGVYAVPAGKYGDVDTYGEWIMWNTKMSPTEYRGYAKKFNPVKYNPEQWVKIAKDAGMRYIVITSKHCDGFALFPSKASSWNVVDASAYGKDLLGPLVKAAHAQDLKIGFYYSQAQDWGNRGGAIKAFKEGDGWDESQKGTFDSYLEKTAIPQVREILTQYPIDLLWWDTPIHMHKPRAEPIAKLIKEMSPNIVSNTRLGGGFGDYHIAEQFVPLTGLKGDWETCMTLNKHWSYNAADHNWKSSTELIQKLIGICAKGGNFLLNVGPTAEGEIPEESVNRLNDVGEWLKENGESIYGTTAGPFPFLSWGAATRKNQIIYLHVFDWPKNGELRLPLLSKIKKTTLLTDPSNELKFSQSEVGTIIQLPQQAPSKSASVIKLEVAEEPVVVPIASLNKKLTATSESPKNPLAAARDGDATKYWEAGPNDKNVYLEYDLGKPTPVHALAVDEPDRWPRYKQDIRVEIETAQGWSQLLAAQSNGHGQLFKFPEVKVQKIRLHLKRELGPPGVAEWQVYSPE